MYPLPEEAPNIPKVHQPQLNLVILNHWQGFEYLGYRTVGIGGVRWFDINKPTARFWTRDFFQEFFYVSQ